KLTDYSKKYRPYLDGIQYAIITNVSTGQLAFVSGKFDMTSPYFFQVPVLEDTQRQAPQATCTLAPTSVLRSVLISRQGPPFNNPHVRRAIALTLDRPAFIETMTQGKGSMGGAL